MRLVVEVKEEPVDALRLAAQVYDGLSEEQAAGVERIVLDRRDLFQPANS